MAAAVQDAADQDVADMLASVQAMRLHLDAFAAAAERIAARPHTTGPDTGETQAIRRVADEILCAICQDLPENTVSLTCGHHFCAACFSSCMTYQETCPTCRRSVGNEVPSKVLDGVARVVREAQAAVSAQGPAAATLAQAAAQVATPNTGNAPAPQADSARASQATVVRQHAQQQPAVLQDRAMQQQKAQQVQDMSSKELWGKFKIKEYSKLTVPSRDVWNLVVRNPSVEVAVAAKAVQVNVLANSVLKPYELEMTLGQSLRDVVKFPGDDVNDFYQGYRLRAEKANLIQDEFKNHSKQVDRASAYLAAWRNPEMDAQQIVQEYLAGRLELN